MVGWIKKKLATQVGLGPNHVVLHGDPAPPQKGGRDPQFSAHVYGGQMAGCIKMPLCMELGLSAGNFVFDEDPALLLKREQSPPYFRPMSIVAKQPDASRCHLVRK